MGIRQRRVRADTHLVVWGGRPRPPPLLLTYLCWELYDRPREAAAGVGVARRKLPCRIYDPRWVDLSGDWAEGRGVLRLRMSDRKRLRISAQHHIPNWDCLDQLVTPITENGLIRCHRERSRFVPGEEAKSRRIPIHSCALTQPDFDCALEPGLGRHRAQLAFFFAGRFAQRDRLGFDCALLTEGVEQGVQNNLQGPRILR